MTEPEDVRRMEGYAAMIDRINARHEAALADFAREAVANGISFAEVGIGPDGLPTFRHLSAPGVYVENDHVEAKPAKWPPFTRGVIAGLLVAMAGLAALAVALGWW